MIIKALLFSCSCPSSFAEGFKSGFKTGAISGAVVGFSELIGASSALNFGNFSENGITSFGSSVSVGRIFAHGFVGGVASEMQGGSFAAGFMSSAISKVTGGYIHNRFAGNLGAQVAAQMAIGGTISELTGGKFVNGAMTVGFQFLFNETCTAVMGADYCGGYNKRLSVKISQIDSANTAVLGIFTPTVSAKLGWFGRFKNWWRFRKITHVDQVLNAPRVLKGVSLEKFKKNIKLESNWVESIMKRTRGTNKGYTLRELNSRGSDFTDRYIQYHPGSRRHFAGQPYWKVSSGKNGIERFSVYGND